METCVRPPQRTKKMPAVTVFLVVVDQWGIEPQTSSLQMRHSTTELLALFKQIPQSRDILPFVRHFTRKIIYFILFAISTVQEKAHAGQAPLPMLPPTPAYETRLMIHVALEYCRLRANTVLGGLGQNRLLRNVPD